MLDDKPIHKTVVDLQARMFARRLKLGVVLESAGVNRSTWWRWTRGDFPKTSSLDKVERALQELGA